MNHSGVELNVSGTIYIYIFIYINISADRDLKRTEPGRYITLSC